MKDYGATLLVSGLLFGTISIYGFLAGLILFSITCGVFGVAFSIIGLGIYIDSNKPIYIKKLGVKE